MMQLTISWTHAIAALLAGLGLGIGFVLTMRRPSKDHIDVDPTTALADAEERVNHLIAQLRDLKEQQARLDPTVFAQESVRLEERAAAALRQRDALLDGDVLPAAASVEANPQGVLAEPTQVPPTTMGSNNATGQVKGFVWGAATVLVIVGLMWMVSSESTQRQSNGSPTGNSSMMQTPSVQSGEAPKAEAPEAEQAAANQRFKELETRIRQDPNDIAALSELTQLLMRAQAIEEAKVVNERILSLDAENTQARVYAAVIRSAEPGQLDAALGDLDALLKKHPDFADAWFFRGMMGMRSGNTELAQESWRKFVAVAPESPRRQRIEGFLKGEGLQMPR
ncbi:MAG: hypothetical protein R3C68_02010 [Myxococcota bacterium]